MNKTLRIILAQLNFIVGDLVVNMKKHMDACINARDQLSADLIVFPELSLTGYTPEDLLLRPGFISDANQTLSEIVQQIEGIHVAIGHPFAKKNGLFNAYSIFYNGVLLGRCEKNNLPNYGVFDERRYFMSGDGFCVVPIHDVPIGFIICEDLWYQAPAKRAKDNQARLIISPNASPFEVDKQERRRKMLSNRAIENQLPIFYVNQVGGQDDLIFDGDSMIMNAQGEICQNAEICKENLLSANISIDGNTLSIPKNPLLINEKIESIYQCLVLAVKDYVTKNHFKKVILGVSGGIDSALTLAIAVDALNADCVKGIFMPSRYTSDTSMTDALAVIKNFGIQYEIISIEPMYQSFLNILTEPFQNYPENVTEQNIQARCRAIILMALSNKFGHLVLTTGNRSELAVGYCTLYGDMVGGFSVLKDIPKTMVYELANYRNRAQQVIPQSIIERAPTAELAENQQDSDTLPPYEVLDAILEKYIDNMQSASEIAQQGYDKILVDQIICFINKNEYKRRQAAVGARINHKAFGKDRRYPITNGYKG